MKALLMTLTILASFAALAHNPGHGPHHGGGHYYEHGQSDYRPVSPHQVESYKTAVQSALYQFPDVISACDPNWIDKTIQNTSNVLVNRFSVQPLLIFNSYYGHGTDLHQLIFTTYRDLKTIEHVEYRTYKLGEVNKGDLANPVIVQDYILQNYGACDNL